ncbi:hypothetical protein BT93_I0523 [Corymbia citriodora subsp. variegata]|nr:hypothetical protein BT93_I0523 [Corymbia citriodora subsp. variegata]
MAAEEYGLPKLQREASEAVEIEVETAGAENVPKDEPGASSSECVIQVQENPKQPHQDDAERLGAKLSIYRIPDYLKEGDVKAYVPQIVPLGPYHHGKEKLLSMEQHKLRCLHRILERSNHEIGLYLESLRNVEERARACYEGTISMSSDDFVEMLVLDGCFVIELIQGVAKGFNRSDYLPSDPIFSMWGSMLKVQIKRDMIMLENQIPLFMLNRLLNLQRRNHIDKQPLASLGERAKGWSQDRQRLIPCVTELQEAGIKFRTNTRNLGDIRFKSEDGILEIPSLVIHEGTRSLFLNLIAFEQSHFDCGNYVTSYYLCSHDIIKHCLMSNAEVANLFNRLCQEVALDMEDSYLLNLSGEYFDNPWSIISFIAALVLLVLTFIQSLYAVYGYYRLRS